MASDTVHESDEQHYLAEGFRGTLVSCSTEDAYSTVASGRLVRYCPLCGEAL